MDLQLNVELWFTENDYKPLDSHVSNNMSSASLTSSSSSAGHSSGNFTNLTSTNTSNSNLTNSSNGMQLLCSRAFKIHFDPRQGIHLQVPVMFDYFHLSAVLTTIHCTLLTLLPPVMIG